VTDSPDIAQASNMQAAPTAGRASSWRLWLAQRDLDRVTVLALPAAAFIILLFVYPFIYGFVLSFRPKAGDWLANYRHFFSDPFLYDTVAATLRLAIPATLINVLIAIPVALRVRLLRRRRLLTTILVVPITLGTVLIAEGLLTYLGPQGWLNRVLMLSGIVSSPIRLVHNYWGVLISLIISGFPFTFLLTLSHVTGIDPSLEQAAATLGANARARFAHIILPLLVPGLTINLCLSFVQTFSVFPSAVLLGAPAGSTRVISIAAYQAAYEAYDYSLAAAIAMIMGFVQLIIVAAVLSARGLFYRGAAASGKG
jgi:putative spermidine/putrescine transport system permease protein